MNFSADSDFNLLGRKRKNDSQSSNISLKIINNSAKTTSNESLPFYDYEYNEFRNQYKNTLEISKAHIIFEKEQDQSVEDIKCPYCNEFSFFQNKCENCESIICEKCLTNNDNNINNSNSEIKNCKICKSKLILNKNIKSELEKFNKLKVKCLCNNPLCKFAFKYEKIMDCLNLCNKAKYMKCNGCKAMFSNIDIKNHINVCEKLFYVCEYCAKKFRKNEILKHTIHCIIEMKNKEHISLKKKLNEEQLNLEMFFAEKKEKERILEIQQSKIDDYEETHIFLFFLFILLLIACFFYTANYFYRMLFN